jgi:hypothetical protein
MTARNQTSGELFGESFEAAVVRRNAAGTEKSYSHLRAVTLLVAAKTS